MDLVIMAAGMGSRFGGLKQLQPVDNDNNFIIDYTVYDAIKAGFDHVVFIIKEEHFADFRETVGRRIEAFVDVDYVFQNTNNIPSEYSVPNVRVKPFGTGHAVLCAKDHIRGDFAVVNADDFYGRDVIRLAHDFLQSCSHSNEYAIAGDKVKNNFGNDGVVKRGVFVSQGGYLKSIDESCVEKRDGKYFAKSLCEENAVEHEIAESHLVSMGLLAFKHEFLNYLQEYFLEFLEENKQNLGTCEFFLPTVVTKLIEKNIVSVKILSAEKSNWFGMTYKEDLPAVKNALGNIKIYD